MTNYPAAWEYKRRLFIRWFEENEYVYSGNQHTDEILNEFGHKGWEVVSVNQIEEKQNGVVSYAVIVLFKRPKYLSKFEDNDDKPPGSRSLSETPP